MLAGAVLYRIDAFLVAYEYDSTWHYFPSARGAGLRLLRQNLPHSARPAGWPRPLTRARI
jgi:hypothetical protein